MADSQADSPFDFDKLLHTVQQTAVSLVNMQRASIDRNIHYVQFTLPSQMNLLPQARNFIQQQVLGAPPMSLLELERAFDRIANDARPQGVILVIRGFAMPFADLQTLRESILRLRRRGKTVICYAMGYNTAEYYVASAADQIILQPGGMLSPTGLVAQQVYLRDGLREVGIELDALQISPYKTGPDTFLRQEPSEEGREMTNWLLDSNFDMIVEDIAAGREMSVDDVRAMIDGAPFTDAEAHQAGTIDAVMNEEGLAQHLGIEDIVLWEDADGLLPLKLPRDPSRYVAVLPAEGMILPGENAQPPGSVPLPFVSDPRIGDLTLVRQARNLMNDDRCAAVVLYVNSPGGDSSASEAIAAALDQLARKKPLVVYMGAVAASGGYYISTPADTIIAQPGSIVGSIGIYAQKIVANEVYNKLKLNPVYYTRGAHAGWIAPIAPFSDAERARLQTYIERFYDMFLERVAVSRKMKVDTVRELADGKVWTGKQALENGLVDQLGGLIDAVDKARELAQLAGNAPFTIVRGKGKALPAQLAEEADPAAQIRYWLETLEHMHGRALALMPFDITFR